MGGSEPGGEDVHLLSPSDCAQQQTSQMSLKATDAQVFNIKTEVNYTKVLITLNYSYIVCASERIPKVWPL